MRLKFLCLDENFIKNFNNLYVVIKLQHLFIRCNKLSDYSEMNGFSELPNLRELDMSQNILGRKHGYRYNIIQRIPSLTYLDGVVMFRYN